MAPGVLARAAMQNYMADVQTPRSSKKNPLENLMFHQLQQLISREKILQKRYAQLGASADSNEEIARFEAEMLQLETRADRLHRMINAMSGNAFI
jgi:hypothetical protein